jgi:tripartite-type tricarboxylate transporter receptor subunit TctC
MNRIHRAVALAALAFSLVSAPASADDVADFYHGRQLVFIIGYSVGGGYDSSGRIWARHLSDHIPGHPTIVVQNMTGAGSMRAANYIYNAAPKDGSVIALFSSGAAMEPLYGDKQARFETAKFAWIASLDRDVQGCGVWKGAGQGIHTLPDLIKAKKMVIFGSTAPDSPTSQYPLFVRNMFHARIKVVQGYKGTKEINLAMQNGEVNGTCGMFESSVRGSFMSDLKNGNLDMFMQVGEHKKIPLFGQATRVYDLLKTDEERRIAEVVFSPSEITRPVAAPPETPHARVAALSKAVMEAAKDPKLIKDAAKLQMKFDPISGEDVQKMFAHLFSQPPALVKKAYWIMTNSK